MHNIAKKMQLCLELPYLHFKCFDFPAEPFKEFIFSTFYKLGLSLAEILKPALSFLKLSIKCYTRATCVHHLCSNTSHHSNHCVARLVLPSLMGQSIFSIRENQSLM